MTRTRDLPETIAAPLERAGAFAALPRRERRRRLRLARRGGRYLFRGRFLPRTLRAVAFVAVVVGIVVGALGAVGYSIYTRDLTDARAQARPVAPVPDGPAGGAVGAGEQTAPVIDQLTVAVGDRTGAAVAVADNGEHRWYATAHELVHDATVVGGPEVVAGTGERLELWRWSTSRRVAVVAGPSTGEPVRAVEDRWQPTVDQVLRAVDLAGDSAVELPAKVIAIGDGDVVVGIDTAAADVGAAVLGPDGSLVGLVTGIGDGVADVTTTAAMCDTVLFCIR